MGLKEMMQAQLDLQVDSYGKDPREMEGEELANFILCNAYALIDEVSEAMDEFKWKPWLTSGRGDFKDRDAFVSELVDAMHFMMNLLLAAGRDYVPDMDDDEVLYTHKMEPKHVASEFESRYFAKRAVNAKRQRDGYTGEKDADGRALDEPVGWDPDGQA